MRPLRLAVFVSGRGSNFLSLIDRIHHPGIYGHIVLVVCNKADAPALEYARANAIPMAIVSYQQGVESAEAEIRSHIAVHDIDLLVLCGYMRLLSREFVHAFPNRIINIHPSLLPAFPGMHAQRQALEHGVKTSGCTVHFVDAGVDSGKIILQESVPILPDDTEATLSARILVREHDLLPKAIELLAKNWWDS